MKISHAFVKNAFALMVLAALAGCHTVEGLGQDIESAGDSIEGAAQDCGDANGC